MVAHLTGNVQLYRKLLSITETMLPFYKGHTLCSASVMLHVVTGEFPPVGMKVDFAIKCLKHSEAASSRPPDRGPLKQTDKWAIFRCDVALLRKTGFDFGRTSDFQLLS